MDLKRISVALTLTTSAAVLMGLGVPAGAAAPEDVVRIDLRHFPEGSPIPDETVIRDQMAFIAPHGDRIRMLVFNGGLSPSAAALMGTLRFSCE